MGFFTKKKEEKRDMTLRFPEFPKYESEISSSEVSQLKDAISDIPMRKPSFNISELEIPTEHETIHKDEKTLFIKVDKYKSVMRSLEDIKSKLNEVEKVLDKLNEIKKEEDDELTKWHSDLSYLKERLNKIDQTLFEH